MKFNTYHEQLNLTRGLILQNYDASFSYANTNKKTRVRELSGTHMPRISALTGTPMWWILSYERHDTMLGICHLNIELTGADVMHDVEYVYSIWST